MKGSAVCDLCPIHRTSGRLRPRSMRDLQAFSGFEVFLLSGRIHARTAAIAKHAAKWYNANR
jgi:hypothetical protein